MSNVASGSFKDYQSITIQGWMVNRLGLTGTKLLVYAAVFTYSSMGDSEFSGGEKALSAMCNVSPDTIRAYLEELAQERLITFSELTHKNKKYRNYKANLKKVVGCFNKNME